MNLDIYIDFKSPTAYLAMQPTLALLEAHPEVQAQWLPFDTRQRPVPEHKADEDRGESHVRVRAEARAATHRYYADVQGITMIFPDTPGETKLALAALLQLRTSPFPFVTNAFHAYWTESANLNDASTVRALLVASGMDPDSFDPGASLANLDDSLAQAQAAGVIDTPAYIVDGQLFMGREHLPWIREILTG